jgi:hypothetical protein
MILKGLKTIDMRCTLGVCHRPDRNTRSRYDFNANANDLSYGFKRSRLAWYSIDPIFYTQNLQEFQMTTCHLPLGESTVKSFIL